VPVGQANQIKLYLKAESSIHIVNHGDVGFAMKIRFPGIRPKCIYLSAGWVTAINNKSTRQFKVKNSLSSGGNLIKKYYDKLIEVSIT